MPSVIGELYLFKINTGTSGSPVYTSIGLQTNAVLNLTMNNAESTTKADLGWKTQLSAIREWSIECDFNFDDTDAGWVEIWDRYNNREILTGRFDCNGTTYTGDVVFSEASIEAPHDDIVTVSCTFEGSGQLTRA